MLIQDASQIVHSPVAKEPRPSSVLYVLRLDPNTLDMDLVPVILSPPFMHLGLLQQFFVRCSILSGGFFLPMRPADQTLLCTVSVQTGFTLVSFNDSASSETVRHLLLKEDTLEFLSTWAFTCTFCRDWF